MESSDNIEDVTAELAAILDAKDKDEHIGAVLVDEIAVGDIATEAETDSALKEDTHTESSDNVIHESDKYEDDDDDEEVETREKVCSERTSSKMENSNVALSVSKEIPEDLTLSEDQRKQLEKFYSADDRKKFGKKKRKQGSIGNAPPTGFNGPSQMESAQKRRRTVVPPASAVVKPLGVSHGRNLSNLISVVTVDEGKATVPVDSTLTDQEGKHVSVIDDVRNNTTEDQQASESKDVKVVSDFSTDHETTESHVRTLNRKPEQTMSSELEKTKKELPTSDMVSDEEDEQYRQRYEAVMKERERKRAEIIAEKARKRQAEMSSQRQHKSAEMPAASTATFRPKFKQGNRQQRFPRPSGPRQVAPPPIRYEVTYNRVQTASGVSEPNQPQYFCETVRPVFMHPPMSQVQHSHFIGGPGFVPAPPPFAPSMPQAFGPPPSQQLVPAPPPQQLVLAPQPPLPPPPPQQVIPGSQPSQQHLITAPPPQLVSAPQQQLVSVPQQQFVSVPQQQIGSVSQPPPQPQLTSQPQPVVPAAPAPIVSAALQFPQQTPQPFVSSEQVTHGNAQSQVVILPQSGSQQPISASSVQGQQMVQPTVNSMAQQQTPFQSTQFSPTSGPSHCSVYVNPALQQRLSASTEYVPQQFYRQKERQTPQMVYVSPLYLQEQQQLQERRVSVKQRLGRQFPAKQGTQGSNQAKNKTELAAPTKSNRIVVQSGPPKSFEELISSSRSRVVLPSTVTQPGEQQDVFHDEAVEIKHCLSKTIESGEITPASGEITPTEHMLQYCTSSRSDRKVGATIKDNISSKPNSAFRTVEIVGLPHNANNQAVINWCQMNGGNIEAVEFSRDGIARIRFEDSEAAARCAAKLKRFASPLPVT